MNTKSSSYVQIKKKYVEIAQEVHKDFLADFLGEAAEKQLYYEAACTSLKQIKTYISSMPNDRKRHQALLFYEDKLNELQTRAKDYESTPYTL